jgi:hypothetical protein
MGEWPPRPEANHPDSFLFPSVLLVSYILVTIAAGRGAMWCGSVRSKGASPVVLCGKVVGEVGSGKGLRESASCWLLGAGSLVPPQLLCAWAVVVFGGCGGGLCGCGCGCLISNSQERPGCCGCGCCCCRCCCVAMCEARMPLLVLQ